MLFQGHKFMLLWQNLPQFWIVSHTRYLVHLSLRMASGLALWYVWTHLSQGYCHSLFIFHGFVAKDLARPISRFDYSVMVQYRDVLAVISPHAWRLWLLHRDVYTAGVLLSPTKAHLFQSEVTILSQRIGCHGRKPLPEHVWLNIATLSKTSTIKTRITDGIVRFFFLLSILNFLPIMSLIAKSLATATCIK